jgi:hypothetical protein
VSSYYIEAQGIRTTIRRLTRMGTAAVRARPAMVKVAALLLEIEGAIFSGQGRRGGGSWKQDTDEWLMRKIRLGLDPRINIASEALMRSMSVDKAPHQLLHIGDTRVLLGSTLPYADKVNEERPFTNILETDKLRMRAIVAEHIKSKMRRG